MSNTRNSSIELLRIIAIMGVVILHYNNESMGGAFKFVEEGSFSQMYLFFTENVFACAVNVFIMISAFFLCKTEQRRFVRIVELVLQVILFQLVAYFVVAIPSGVVSFGGIIVNMIPLNYFVILYSVLYLISPYFNIVIHKLGTERLKKLVFILFLMFSVWTIGIDYVESVVAIDFGGFNPVGLKGSQAGYTIVNFSLVYFIGAYIRESDIKIDRLKTVALIFVIIAVMLVISIIEHKLGSEGIVTWHYNNPLIIVMSALVVKLFSEISFESKIINELAKATFTCFLLHEMFISKVKIEQVTQEGVIVIFVHQLLVAVSLYLASYIVYKIYSFLTGWFIKLIKPLCDKVNISLDVN